MTIWVFLGILAASALLYAIFASPERKAKDQARYDAKKQARAANRPKPISQVGKTAAGTLACPNCGGTQFKARRSNKKRAALVGAAVLTPLTKQTLVQCVTCGAKYQRA